MWIDGPFIDMVEYFAGSLGFFLDIARKLAWVISIIAIIWNCIQVSFGTMEVQKFAISSITKFFMFMLIINVYPATVSAIMRFSTNLGIDGSGQAVETLESTMSKMMNECSKIVEKETAYDGASLSELNEALDEARSTQWLLQMPGGSLGAAIKGIDITQVNEKVSSIEKLKQQREMDEKQAEHAARTAETLKKVLKKDNTNLSSAYSLDIIAKKENKETGYLSPNSMLTVALLTAQIMWEYEWTSVNQEWIENDKEGLASLTDSLTIISFPFRRIFDMLLVGFCSICIILCMIFSLCQYVMCIIEFTICVSFSVLFVPCLIFDGLKEFSNNIIKTILAQSVKLAMITFCMFFALWANAGLAMETIQNNTGFDLTTFAYVMFVILISFALTQNAPKLAIAILNGQPQMSMGELVAAAATAGATGVAIGSAGAATARFGVNRVSDVGAVGGAIAGSAKTQKEKAQANGDSGFMTGLKTVGGAIAGGVGESAWRAGSHIKSGLSNAARYKGGSVGRIFGASGGGSFGGFGSGGSHSSSGSGMNRFGSSNQTGNKSKMGFDVQTDREGNEIGRKMNSGTSMNFAEAVNEKGQRMTAKEHVASQAQDAYSRWYKPSSPTSTTTPNTTPNNSSNLPAIIPNFDFTSSYNPEKNVTPSSTTIEHNRKNLIAPN